MISEVFSNLTDSTRLPTSPGSWGGPGFSREADVGELVPQRSAQL